MTQAVLLRYENDFDEDQILDIDDYRSVVDIRNHLIDKHGGIVNDFNATLNDNQISVIRFYMIDNVDEEFYVDVKFVEVTKK